LLKELSSFLSSSFHASQSVYFDCYQNSGNGRGNCGLNDESFILSDGPASTRRSIITDGSFNSLNTNTSSLPSTRGNGIYSGDARISKKTKQKYTSLSSSNLSPTLRKEKYLFEAKPDSDDEDSNTCEFIHTGSCHGSKTEKLQVVSNVIDGTSKNDDSEIARILAEK
jgi:hypothetical protein